MTTLRRVGLEIRALLFTTAFFGLWIGLLILLKTMLLAEYSIPFHRWTMIVIGALVLAKVVIVLEHVSLGRWMGGRPAWVDLLVRTAMYSVGVSLILLLEHGFSGRHEYGGFVAAMQSAILADDTPHLVINSVCVAMSLLCYNTMTVIRKQIGDQAMKDIFLQPLPENVSRGHAESETGGLWSGEQNQGEKELVEE